MDEEKYWKNEISLEKWKNMAEADDWNCFGLIFNFVDVYKRKGLCCYEVELVSRLFIRKAPHALNGFSGQIS